MESVNDSTARLRWRCRRGTREMDLLLLRFLERGYPRLSAGDQSLFEALLNEADPDLYAWITGKAEPDNPTYLPVIDKIIACSRSDSLNNVIPDRDCPVSSDREVIGCNEH